MKSNVRNVKLTSVDNLFTTEENRQEIQADAKWEKVQMHLCWIIQHWKTLRWKIQRN